MKFPAWHRIWALVLRYLYIQFRELGRIFEITFWPVVDVVMFGFIGAWLPQSQSTLFIAASMPLLGALLWQVVKQANLEVSVNILEELWQQNLFNLFTTPLVLAEWVLALLLIGLIRVSLMLLFSSCVVYLLFGFNLFSLGFVLVPVVGLLVISGWILGFISGSCIIYWGQKAQSLSWAMTWVFAPFCAVFYPLTVLPGWMQAVGKLLPMTYVFEGLRGFVTTGNYPTQQLLLGFMLSGVYFVLVLILFTVAFTLSKRRGLVRLEKI